MPKPVPGSHPTSAKASKDRGAALERLASAIAHLEFPVTRADLLAAHGSFEVHIGDTGATMSLTDLIGDLNALTFSSPAHVREVVDLAWQDWATERRSDYGSG